MNRPYLAKELSNALCSAAMAGFSSKDHRRNLAGDAKNCLDLLAGVGSFSFYLFRPESLDRSDEVEPLLQRH
jgi:hypothetical protein